MDSANTAAPSATAVIGLTSVDGAMPSSKATLSRKRLVLGRATDEDDALDVVRTQPGLLERLAGGLDGLVHLGCDQVVVQRSG
jgi:hypothetical protein